jgi:glucose/arabinose dehydrogenase
MLSFKVGMIPPKLLSMAPLIMVTMLTAIVGGLTLSADTAMGWGIARARTLDSATRDALGGTKIVAATNIPEDFEEIEVVTSLRAPTNMEFSPDGRLFVLEQAGKILIIKNGELLPTLFLTLSEVDGSAEGGLLGLAFDPQFNINGHLYVYYTKAGDPLTNQVSRFTVSATNPDVADPSSELVILDGIPAGPQHNGGQMQFGPDGKLYVATGEITKRSNAQSLRVLAGKILRINPDGSVPADNPFVGTPDVREEIWAYGLRNPFAGDIDPVTGRMYINDVGRKKSEEINLGMAGANYGWPECQGKCENPHPDFEDPIYAYSYGKGCAITGGAFYRGTQFPEEYQGNYFFADLCDQWIKRLLPDGTEADFVTEGPKMVVDLEVAPDGSLYYLLYSKSGSYTTPTEADGAVGKIQFARANRTPTAVVSARPTSGIAPLEVSFDGSGSSDPDGDSLSYTWDFGDESPTTNGVTASHTYTKNGLFDVHLVVDDQKGGTNSATLTIRVGNPPVGKITTPKEEATFNTGDTIKYRGTGTDSEDGALPASAFSWSVRLLHHPETDPHHHFHPFQEPIQGVKRGSFQIPEEVHDDGVWYRIYLTVTDSDGLTHVSTRDIFPVPN